jgi:hypothetical protein
VTRFILIVMIAAVASLCSAQSLWVGDVTGTNDFNFSPGYAGGEFTASGNGQLAFYDHSGSDSLTSLDLIVAFVNPPATPPNIIGVEVYTNVGNVDGSDNISAGAGTSHVVNLSPSGPTQLNSGKVADVLPGMPGISNSESTSNFDVAETKDGITQTGGYALYVYNLSAYASSFGDYGLLEITFGAGVAQGAVALGWGCGGASCADDYTSVATQSAFVDQKPGNTVPEPASVVLFGTVGLLTLRLWRNRSGRSLHA